MKKILALVLVICLAMAIGVGATLAYFTAEEEKTNTFTVGNVDITLTEPSWADEFDDDDFEGQAQVYPGEALAKDPTVTNDGANPCFVRIQVEGLDCLGEAENMLIKYRTDYVDGALGTDWVKLGDYFYYTKVLAVGETTDALFDQIVIPTGLKNGDGEAKFDIDVTAYAVQAQGAKPSFSAVEAMTVEEIAAWFATCGM